MTINYVITDTQNARKFVCADPTSGLWWLWTPT
jgi:hypothetical protein